MNSKWDQLSILKKQITVMFKNTLLKHKKTSAGGVVQWYSTCVWSWDQSPAQQKNKILHDGYVEKFL
jgi:hypothetical protein